MRWAGLALALLVGVSASAAADQDAEARFHDLLRQELRRRAALEGNRGAYASLATRLAFGEAGDDGVAVANELADDRDPARAALGRELRFVVRPSPRATTTPTPPAGCQPLTGPYFETSHDPPPRRSTPSARLARARQLWMESTGPDEPELLRLVRDADRDVRVTAACALAWRGDATGVPVLLNALGRGGTRHASAWGGREPGPAAALEELTGVRAVAQLAPTAEGGFLLTDERTLEAGWRAWWERNGPGFDALKAHLGLLRAAGPEAGARFSLRVLGCRGDLATASELLRAGELPDADEYLLAPALCAIAARHDGVPGLLATAAREDRSDAVRRRALDVLAQMGTVEPVLIDMARTGSVGDLDLVATWCASPRVRCSRSVTDELLARLPWGEDEQALRACRALRGMVGRTDIPRLRAIAATAPPRVRAAIEDILPPLQADNLGMVIRVLPEGGLALQWWGPRGGRGDGDPVGEPIPIEGTKGRESEPLGPKDDAEPDSMPDGKGFDPALRRAYACATAAMADARTTVGLVMALRGDDPTKRRLAATALKILACVRRDVDPECAPSPSPQGSSALEQPYVRAQLEACAAGTDPDVAAYARGTLKLLAGP